MSMRQDDGRVWVDLSLAEMLYASNVGTIRHYEAEMAGRRPTHGMEKSDKDFLTAHIQGAIGELLVAKTRDRYFMPTVNTFKAADLGKNIQVRFRREHNWDMVIRDNDDPEHIFVHVTGKGPTYCIRGWAYAKNVMLPQYRANHGGYRESWFVPELALKPFHIKNKDDANDAAT